MSRSLDCSTHNSRYFLIIYFLSKHKIVNMQQSLYPLDLACDFFLFLKLKIHLEDVEDILKNTTAQFHITVLRSMKNSLDYICGMSTNYLEENEHFIYFSFPS